MIEWLQDEAATPMWRSRAWVILAICLLADNVKNRRGERIVAMCPNPGGEQ